MSRLEIILYAILSISLIFNIGVFIYARAAITRLLFVSEELGDLQEMINGFAGHLKAVYELDSFYGDQTLRQLLNHAISFNEQLETFEHIYSLTEEVETENDTKENSPEETEEA
tara:strand:- start:571 stop:912 length:342 start_codon:yes stop_codon:yes gene_type:complete